MAVRTVEQLKYCLLTTSRRQSARSDLPIFTPTTGARGGNGLDLLAAAAFSSCEKHAEEGYVAEPMYIGSLSKPGPFNPAASLAPKEAKKILDLNFIEMSEVTLDMPPDPNPGRPPTPGRPLINELSQWIEQYSVMAGLLCKQFPHKAPELFAYLASIVYAERCYESGRWLAYDQQFRREALARKCLDWSVPNKRLYTEAFTGRGKPIPRCSVCLQDDHRAQRCPHNRTTSQRTAPWVLPRCHPIQSGARRPCFPSTISQSKRALSSI